MLQLLSCALQGHHLSILRRSRGAEASVVLVLTLGLLCMGCSTKQVTPEVAEIVDLSQIWNHPSEIKLSDFTADIEYVPLETRPDCLIGDPRGVIVQVLEKHIAISSGTLLIFDRKGRFLNKIGAIGHGPREYAGSTRFSVDEKKGRVDILDVSRFRVVSFRITGEFIGEFSIKKGNEPLITRDATGRLGIFYLTNAGDPGNPTRIEWISDTGEVLDSIPVYTANQKAGGAFMAIFSNLYWSGNDLLFNENPLDTIYRLTPERRWEPRWIVDVGPKRMPSEVSLDLGQFQEGLYRYNLAKIFQETHRYLIFGTNCGRLGGVAVYDKKTKQALYMPQPADSASGLRVLRNDFDGGPPISSFFFVVVSHSEDYFITPVTPMDLMEAVTKDQKPGSDLLRPDLFEKVNTLASRLTENDNPVLMLVRMKN
ncbi:MAG TPA: hypothetical protein DC042_06165 [Bacteroidales bacterium]|nr:hypothetical protein [Bacteroidales bacterium]